MISGIIQESTSEQMSMIGWSLALDDINWVESGANCTFYGCNTGRTSNIYGNFSKTISTLPNLINVQVSGQTKFSYPSFSPSYRMTNVTRSAKPNLGFFIGETYMVGSSGGLGLSSQWFNKGTVAHPFAVYRNGGKVGLSFQSKNAISPMKR